MKRIFTLLLAAVMLALACVSFVACTESKKDKLVIGITYYKPMNYKDDTGKLVGFDTEFAEAVCEKLGKEPEFLVIDWKNKFIELDADTIDCIWNGMTITDEALANADVSTPYVKNAQVVVTKADIADDFAEFADMKNLKFAAEAGSAGEECITDAGFENYTAVTAQSDALNEVSTGAADACVIDLSMANSMIGEGTSYSALAQAMKLNEEEYGIACRKGDKLLDDINAAMAEMKADGSLQKLAEKYNLTLA